MESHKNHIFLDNHSTTQVDDRVVAAMLPFLSNNYGNPSSNNFFGLNAKMAVKKSREQVASIINASPNEIYFTSGATEAINWAIRGVIEKATNNKKHIITSTIEHSAVLKTCDFLEKRFGVEITRIKPNPLGLISPSDIKAAINPDTVLVAIQHANNEIGTIQEIKEIGTICKKAGVIFLVDAAQTIGKISCDVTDMNIDLLAVSGHKLYAPKGIGFLFLSEGVKTKINPLIYGGGQENGFRSGTQNVPYIVAIGKACSICQTTMQEESQKIISLRTIFINFIQKKIPDMVINGSLDKRLPGNINLSVPGVISDVLLRNLTDITISKGSACNSSKITQSHVLQSISHDDSIIDSAIRIGIGRFNTESEIILAATKIATIIHEIKKSNEQF